MNIDSERGIDALRTEAVRVSSNPATVYCSVSEGGFPESGGATVARQEGQQYTLRFKATDYAKPTPKVHDKIYTTNYGTLEVKQVFIEGRHYAIRATGKVAGRMEIA